MKHDLKVEIIDPTNWSGAFMLFSLIAVGAMVGIVVMLTSKAIMVKLASLLVIGSFIVVPIFMESQREQRITDKNVSMLETTYEIKNLQPEGNDRPGGGVWIDPSEGEKTEVHASWIQADGTTAHGVVIMDFKGSAPIATLRVDRVEGTPDANFSANPDKDRSKNLTQQNAAGN